MAREIGSAERMQRRQYEVEWRRLQIELLKLQRWVEDTGQQVVVVGCPSPCRAVRPATGWRPTPEAGEAALAAAGQSEQGPLAGSAGQGPPHA